MNEKQIRMSKVFNEWNRRYAEDPDSFEDLLDENGKAREDYGDCAALYFTEIENEMQGAGKL